MGTIHCLDNEGTVTWYILIYTHLTTSPLKLLTGNSGSLYRGWRGATCLPKMYRYEFVQITTKKYNINH